MAAEAERAQCVWSGDLVSAVVLCVFPTLFTYIRGALLFLLLLWGNGRENEENEPRTYESACVYVSSCGERLLMLGSVGTCSLRWRTRVGECRQKKRTTTRRKKLISRRRRTENDGNFFRPPRAEKVSSFSSGLLPLLLQRRGQGGCPSLRTQPFFLLPDSRQTHQTLKIHSTSFSARRAPPTT
jgi:hypothetical protein